MVSWSSVLSCYIMMYAGRNPDIYEDPDMYVTRNHIWPGIIYDPEPYVTRNHTWPGTIYDPEQYVARSHIPNRREASRCQQKVFWLWFPCDLAVFCGIVWCLWRIFWLTDAFLCNSSHSLVYTPVLKLAVNVHIHRTLIVHCTVQVHFHLG